MGHSTSLVTTRITLHSGSIRESIKSEKHTLKARLETPREFSAGAAIFAPEILPAVPCSGRLAGLKFEPTESIPRACFRRRLERFLTRLARTSLRSLTSDVRAWRHNRRESHPPSGSDEPVRCVRAAGWQRQLACRCAQHKKVRAERDQPTRIRPLPPTQLPGRRPSGGTCHSVCRPGFEASGRPVP